MNYYQIVKEIPIVVSLSDIWSISITLIGFVLSILTLLYSIVVPQRREQEKIQEKKKYGHDYSQRDLDIVTHDVRNTKDIISDFSWLLVVNFIFFIVLTPIKNQKTPNDCFVFIMYLVFFVLLCFHIRLFYKMYQKYKDDIN